MPTLVECSNFCSGKLVYIFSKTSTSHKFFPSYRNRANFIAIWDRIEFSLQCLLWNCVVVFVVQNLCILFVKLQTVIIFAPIIEIGKILYQFGIKLIFFRNAVFVVKKLCMLLVKLQTAITFVLVIET